MADFVKLSDGKYVNREKICTCSVQLIQGDVYAFLSMLEGSVRVKHETIDAAQAEIDRVINPPKIRPLDNDERMAIESALEARVGFSERSQAAIDRIRERIKHERLFISISQESL